MLNHDIYFDVCLPFFRLGLFNVKNDCAHFEKDSLQLKICVIVVLLLKTSIAYDYNVSYLHWLIQFSYTQALFYVFYFPILKSYC